MDRKAWLVLIALLVAEAVASLESGMVIAGIPRWVAIHGDAVKVGWLVSSFLIVQGAAAVLGGRLGDMFGRRRVMMVALGTCVAASLLSGFARDLDLMIGGRAIQGVAGAIQPLCYGLVREHLPRERMRFGVSAIVAMAAGSAAVGILFGGYLTDHFGPQSIFLSMSITGFVALVLVALLIPGPAEQPVPEKIDWLGGVLFVPGVVMVLVAVSYLEGGSGGHGTALTLGLGGIAVLAVWAIYELRHKEPMIDVRLLANRDIALANVIIALSAVSLMQVTLVFAMLVQQSPATGVGLGGSATMVGLLFAPSLLAGSLASLVVGWLADRTGPRLPIMAACLLSGVSTALAIVWHDSFIVLGAILVLINIGNVILYSGVMMVVVAAAPPDRVSEASGFPGVLRSTFRALGTQLVMVLLMSSATRVPGKPPTPTEEGYVLVFGVTAAVVLLACVVALGIRSPARGARGAAAKVPA